MFTIFLGIAVFGTVCAVVNMLLGFLGKINATTMVSLHLLFGIIYLIGYVGSLITGIIWIVEKFTQS